MDFYEISMKHVEKLTKSEMKIYQYILDNIDKMSDKTVRSIAHECFVSTSTILRLVKKIGFDGFNEMNIVIKFTLNQQLETSTVITEGQINYKQEYLKNIIETIRVIDDEVVTQLATRIKKSRRLYIFSRGSTKSYSNYFEFLFKLKGIDTYFPANSDSRKLFSEDVKADDIVIFIDYQGSDEHLLAIITKIKAKKYNNIISITQANNNIMQNLSDYNLYYFSDEVKINGFDATSNISVIAILETIFHNI